MKTVLFYVEHSFQLEFLSPTISEYVKTGHNVSVYCPENISVYAINLNVMSIEYIEDIKASKMIARLDYLFKKYLVPMNFSQTYYRKFSYNGVKPLHKFINKQLSLSGNYSKSYVLIFGVFARLRLVPQICDEYDEVHLCTKLRNTFLFVDSRHKLITYQESWDHPQKGPYFFLSKKHYCWPKLYDITKVYQPDIGTVVPLKEVPKFNYIKHFQPRLPTKRVNDFIQKYRGQYLLYPICTSSAYHNVNNSELQFVKLLIKFCINAELPLLIRPYPLAPKEDLEKLLGCSDLVLVDDTVSATGGLEVFDALFMGSKIYQIKNAKVIVNIGTTFAFDAAVLDKPVLQLNLGSNFGGVAEISDYEHIVSFLNDDLPKLKKYRDLHRYILKNMKSMDKSIKLKSFLSAD